MWAMLRRTFAPSLPSGSAYELLPTDGGERPRVRVPHIQVHDADEHPLPSTAQLATLRRVPGRVPMTAYTLALVELAERASYYGVGGVFTNFIQRPMPEGSTTGAPVDGNGTPGALGMGLRVATALSTLFTLMAFTTPLAGGALADMRWGKLPTIAFGTVLAGVAHILSVYAALPSVLQGDAFTPFLSSLILLGGSAGLIKANIAPLMAEQYVADDYIDELPTGEKVIVEREATVQKIMAAYYHSINIGAFIAVTSTFAEKYVGFWLAFLIPGAIFFLMPPVLLAVQPHLRPPVAPSSTAVLDVYHFARRAHTSKHDEDTDVRQVFQVIKLFLFFTVYNVADGGLNSLMTSLAGSMTTNGVPNDFLEKANPLAIVLSIPILNKIVYPYLNARRIAFGPIRRIVFGFGLAALAMAWCAVLQYKVYHTSPCGYESTTCDGVSPLSAWLVLPAPLLTGLSESIAVVTAMELGYTMSPPGLKSIVTAVFLFMQATGAGVVLLFLPLMHDPALVWPFALTAVGTLAAGYAVWRLFKHIDSPLAQETF